MRNLLGDKFVFMSGCEHLFCLECLREDVTMKLDQSLIDKYEQFSVNNAIAQMDDMGWCPMKGCGSLANIEKAENSGKCQHCEFYFCLDCKNKVHPFKRCDLNRVDLLMMDKNNSDFLETQEGNVKAA